MVGENVDGGQEAQRGEGVEVTVAACAGVSLSLPADDQSCHAG